MATPINIKGVSWKDPTSAKDQNGQTVAWDAATDRAGMSIKLDGTGVVSVPVAAGVSTFDLRTLAAYQALQPGPHTLGLAEVTKEGIVGEYASDVPFLVGFVPGAPTEVALV